MAGLPAQRLRLSLAGALSSPGISRNTSIVRPKTESRPTVPSPIRDRMASTPEMLEAFGDQALIAAALAFEAALARSQAAEGLIPDAAAEAIAAACQALNPSAAELAEAAAHAGALAIPL